MFRKLRFRLTVPLAAVVVLAAVVIPTGTPGRAAAAAGSGTSVGFWAGQDVTPCLAADPLTCPRDVSAYTPQVWQALADTHSFLNLDLVYGSDFGPVPAGENARTDGLALIRQANSVGVPVNAWITVPLSEGTFANQENATVIQQAVEAFHSWSAAQRVRIGEPVLDLEFPAGYQAVHDALSTGDLSGIKELMRANIDPAAQCTAMRTYRDTISWAHEHGMRISGSPVPFALDDLADGRLALQNALNIVAFPPLGYDGLYLQAYRAFGVDLGSGYVASYYEDMRRYFGAVGQVSIGNAGIAPYNQLGVLVDDVRMLAGLGATSVPVFDLEGTVSAFGADGVRAVVNAGHDPMTGSELATATRPTLAGTAARSLFDDLDQIADGLTVAVTTLQGHPQQANTYPDGCGDLTAVPLGAK